MYLGCYVLKSAHRIFVIVSHQQNPSNSIESGRGPYAAKRASKFCVSCRQAALLRSCPDAIIGKISLSDQALKKTYVICAFAQQQIGRCQLSSGPLSHTRHQPADHRQRTPLHHAPGHCERFSTTQSLRILFPKLRLELPTIPRYVWKISIAHHCFLLLGAAFCIRTEGAYSIFRSLFHPLKQQILAMLRLIPK